MSANAEFSTTLDYEFIGGGSVIVTGVANVLTSYSLNSSVEVLTVPQPIAEFSGTIEYSITSTGNVTISGISSNVIENSLISLAKAFVFGEANTEYNFSFSGAGGYKPIEGYANLSFDFSVSATAEFGVQRRGFANTRIEFAASAEGALPVKASANYPLDFFLQSTATQFSLGKANCEFAFSVNSNLLNYSLQIYDTLGKNEIELVAYEFNEVEVLNENNLAEIIDSGRNEAKVLSY